MNVIKRNGTKKKLEKSKIDNMISYILHTIPSVNEVEVKRKMHLQLYDGIKTLDIHSSLTSTLQDMITLKSPEYEYAAGKSAMVDIYKDAYGSHVPLNFIDLVKRNIADGFYMDIFSIFSEEEVIFYGELIDHEKDKNFKYLGVRVFQDKYLISNKKTNKYIEGPQELFMLVSMLLFQHTKNKNDIIDMYIALNNFEVSLPTPIMSGLRTMKYGYASCCVIEPADTKKGITAGVVLLTEMGSLRAGIGISTANIRGSGAGVANNTIIHTGKVPILQWYEKSINPFVQGSRNNSANNINSIWDWDVEKLLTLKSNKSTEENSVSGLTFSFLLPRLLFKRAIENKEFTLFSSEDTRLLLDNLYDTDLWEKTYVEYENNENIRKKKISARVLMEKFAIEYFETGRVHPIFINNANDGPFKCSIRTTNLCVEIYLPTTPINSVDDNEAELPLCMLANVNLGMTKLDRIPRLTELLVRGLNTIIDVQEYPNEIIRRTMMNGRYVGVGVSDVAHYIAKNKVKYDSEEAKELLREASEYMQYYLLKASNELSIKHGEAKWFRKKSKYSDGWLPNDGKWKYFSKENLDDLRDSIVLNGLYNLTLSSTPPAGTSADISGSTNGVSMPKAALISKITKFGAIPAIVPDYLELKDYYTFGKDVDNLKFIELISVINDYTDQGISLDVDWYESDLIKEGDDIGKFSINKMINALFKANDVGMNSLYYSTFNTEMMDENGEKSYEEKKIECAGGACEL